MSKQTTAGHTPGPWFAKGRYIGTANHMSYIAECSDENCNWANTPMSVANARLIAAAPELLAALQAVLHQVKQGPYVFADSDAYRFALAAVAKATGAAA
ncbi:hypothetical protein [Massilia violaceinigra]|uniref:hypothetical protein n=1 Tax=Massilia violaceinigra TaxID=2045208 RepID=UPI0012FD8042|nr:hypothetical protein [Massilia violaceinigra]